MDNPVEEIPQVLKALCQGTPDQQQQALRTFFLPDAAFTHPFCRVPSVSPVNVPGIGPVSSRDAIQGIYRWYKIMSPRIDLELDSKAFDKRKNVLYLTVRQRFAIWFLPFHSSNVRLVVELHLVHQRPPMNNNNGADGGAANNSNSNNRAKYYIAKQEDHYQVNEFLRFLVPPLPQMVYAFQLVSTLICVLLMLPVEMFRRYVDPVIRPVLEGRKAEKY